MERDIRFCFTWAGAPKGMRRKRVPDLRSSAASPDEHPGQRRKRVRRPIGSVTICGVLMKP